MFEDLKRIIEEIEKRIEFDPNNENKYKVLIESYPTLNFVIERELFKQYKSTGDKEIRNIIFRCHLRDVYEACKETSEYKIDSISEGNVLLLQLIDEYDYRMPYSSFRQYLKPRLKLFYKGMFDNNDAFLNTRMSTYDLACLEEAGKNLTESNEVEDEHGELTNEDQEKLIIIPRKEKYLLSRKEGKAIFKEVFKNTLKVKKNVLNKKYRTDDIDY